jgi:hypothetical protein
LSVESGCVVGLSSEDQSQRGEVGVVGIDLESLRGSVFVLDE